MIIDNKQTNRRELWVEIEGIKVMYGWADARILTYANLAPYWHPEIPFGTSAHLQK